MLNALTVDVEDYFQVNAFAGVIDPAAWDTYPLRVGGNTRRVMDLFDEFNVKATFFILGWVAERLPDLSREVLRRGHEVACHGYGHQLIYLIGPERFREDVTRAKSILEDQTGVPVNGYRAPSYSITSRSLWALDILVEAGFTYDSSIFPVYHDTYGMPDAPRFPHTIRRSAGEIREFPPTTLPLRLGPMEYRLPVSGGGYMRLFPASLVSHAIDRVNRLEGQPAVLYFHPWEIDPGQPRVPAGWKSRFRHYLNLEKTEGKLRSILPSRSFTTMEATFSAITTPLRQFTPAEHHP